MTKHEGAQAMARLRAEKLSPGRRSEIASGAAKARWGKAVIRTKQDAEGAIQRLAKKAGVSEAEINPGPARTGPSAVPVVASPAGVVLAERCSKHKQVRCRRCQP